MIQKIIRVGNSAAVTIPKDYLKALQVKVGTKIDVTLTEDASRIIIDIPAKRTQTKIPVNKEVYAVADDLLRRYLPAFKKLAKPHETHGQISHY